LTCVAWSDRRYPWLAMALGLAVTVVPTLAVAGTQVSGNSDAVQVEAQNAPVEEILAALAKNFNVQFRSSADLDKRLTGTYEGTLNQVVARILIGYNFVVKSGDKGLEVILLGSAKTFAAISAPSTSKPVDDGPPRSDSTAADPSRVLGAFPVPTVRIAQQTPQAPTSRPSTSGGPTLGPTQAAAPPATTPSPGAALVPGPATAALPSPMPKDPKSLTPGAAPSLEGP
jgi:hypothetical protein